MKKLLMPFVTLLLLAVISSMILLVCVMATAPNIDKVSAAPEGYQCTILDDEGKVMKTIAGPSANRVYVTLDTIPEDLQHAFIAIEDNRFYKHHGIDPRGIARAVFNGIKNGGLSEGGSTITQQLLKNNVFTDWMSEDKLTDKVIRKLQEQYLAVRLEQKYSKEWILENYLNTINLGNGSWGVQVAADIYFDKSVSDLNLAESALIAGITKNPSGYNPLTHPEESLKRQHLVLDAMLRYDYISQDAYEDALSDDVIERIEKAQNNNDNKAFSYFEDTLLTHVKNDLIKKYGYSADDAWQLIYCGGLTIYTTEDPDIQRIAEKAVLNADLADSEQQVSVVVTDVSTGAVKAIVGGSGPKTASLLLNRATDSLRQPGSTIKVIGEYAAGMESGEITLGTVMDDAPTAYSNGLEIHNASYTFSGKTTVREAIIQSLNTLALKCYQQVGESKVLKQLESFGITTLTKEDHNEALALGGTSGGVTNLEMTEAYNALACGGLYHEAHFYTKVLDHDGNLLLETHPDSYQAVSEDTAILLTNAMKDVMKHGTGAAASFSSELPMAGKTGTTSDMKDVWMIGYTPYFTCGVWGGYDDYRKQESSTYVKTLWRSIMKEVHANYLYKDFPKSNNLTTAVICTKCGGLAVSGLCDQTVQGDTTHTEYFLYGQAPGTYCSCHQAVTICTTSGMLAGKYCPEEETETAVYLLSGTADTADEEAVIPSYSTQTCSTHTSFWNDLLHGLFGESEQLEGEDSFYEDPVDHDPSHDEYHDFEKEDNHDGEGEAQGGDSWLWNLFRY